MQSNTLTLRRPLFPSVVLGTLIVVVTEVMFFVALMSAFTVIKGTKSSFGVPSDIRLPVMTTAFNTAILFLSGILFHFSIRLFKQKAATEKVRALYLRAILLGLFFVAFQGYEWVRLISFGLTMQSSIFGALFFLLIGMHGLHALSGIGAMSWYFWKTKASTDIKPDQSKMKLEVLNALQIFWFFIVGIWPFLYGMVYF